MGIITALPPFFYEESDKLKLEFGSKVKPVLTPLTEPQETLDFNWIAGFTEAEGCFYSQINNSKTTKSGKAVGIGFKIGLHSYPLRGLGIVEY